ncbi:hypothetical protein Tco_1277444 [Tanacetum coccineum]
MGISNEHQLKFNSIKDVKSLLQAVEKSSEVLDQTFDRLQKLISQLEIHGENVKGTSSSSSNTQNVAFVSSNSTSSTNGAVNTAHGATTASTQATVVNSTTIDNLSDVVIFAFFASQLNSPQLENEDLQQINLDYLEEIDLSDQAEEGSTNFALMAYSSTSSNSEVVDKCKTSLGYNAIPPPYTGNFMTPKLDLSFSGLEEVVNEPIVSEPTIKKPVVETCEAKARTDKPKVARKNFGPPLIKDWISDSEDEAMLKPKIEKKTVKPSFSKIEFVKSKEQVKSHRKTTIKQGNQNRLNIHNPRGNQINWNYMMSQRLRSNFEMINKACYVCGSFDHLQYDCDNHQRQFNNKKMVKPVWNYTQRVNHQNFSRITHPSPKRNIVPKAVLMKSGLVNTARQKNSKTAVSVNTTRQVNTAQPRTTVNSARPMTNIFNKPHSTVKRPINNKIRGNNVNTARPKRQSIARLEDKGVINSGCSRHMTGNMSYLTDFKEINGGYIAFGGNPKGGKITGKVPRKTNMYSVDLKNIVPKGGLTCLFAKATFDESKL